MRAVVAALLLAAGPAWAQDLVFDIGDTQACLDRSLVPAERRGCIGRAAAQCMEATPLGGSTMGMTECLGREHSWWDAELNAAYQAARRIERAEDAEMAGIAPYQSQAEALRDMQRAWIPFRDAKCQYEVSQWTGGSGGNPAWVNCLMQETAEQALYLQHMIESW